MKIMLNPDKEFVEEIRTKLKENDGYCPCALEKTDDTKCMCKEFRETPEGMCHCGLYYKTKNKGGAYETSGNNSQNNCTSTN